MQFIHRKGSCIGAKIYGATIAGVYRRLKCPARVIIQASGYTYVTVLPSWPATEVWGRGGTIDDMKFVMATIRVGPYQVR